jgi:hypothetical protein
MVWRLPTVIVRLDVVASVRSGGARDGRLGRGVLADGGLVDVDHLQHVTPNGLLWELAPGPAGFPGRSDARPGANSSPSGNFPIGEGEVGHSGLVGFDTGLGSGSGLGSGLVVGGARPGRVRPPSPRVALSPSWSSSGDTFGTVTVAPLSECV